MEDRYRESKLWNLHLSLLDKRTNPEADISVVISISLSRILRINVKIPSGSISASFGGLLPNLIDCMRGSKPPRAWLPE
jgi:hypothetical protein